MGAILSVSSDDIVCEIAKLAGALVLMTKVVWVAKYADIL